MEITDIRHVGFFSPEPEAHRTFYQEVWGLELAAEEEGVSYLRGASGEHHLLSIHPGKGAGLHHVAFGMKDRSAIDIAADELAAEGVSPIEGPHELAEAGGGYGFRFLDPEGRCIELSADVQQHSNGWTPKRVEPLRLCHVVLNSAKFEETVRFYTEILGFRVSDWSEDQMAFLRCNPKHHVVSFNRSSHPSLNHVAYLVANVDEVMRGISNLRRHGREPDWGPGRHGPGNNIFCYFKDPLGYVAEYTSDIDRIEDEASHEPRVWKRVPEFIDRWGTAGPPSADIRRAMAGDPDPGWASRPPTD